MVCCTIIALFIGAFVWLLRRTGMLPQSATPLSWTLENGQQSASRGAFSFRLRAKSFSYALRGIGYVCRHEHNVWIHLSAAIAVIALGLIMRIEAPDWRWIILSIAIVLFAETVNTAIEALCDALHPHHDPAIGLVKDIAAGAVLIGASSAALVGILTFAPYFG